MCVAWYTPSAAHHFKGSSGLVRLEKLAAGALIAIFLNDRVAGVGRTHRFSST
jgi:hypothetical protein